MNKWLNEIGRSFRGVVDRAHGKTNREIELKLFMERCADNSLSDKDIVHELFIFLHKFPEERKSHNFQTTLQRVMDRRPGTVKLITDRLNSN